MVGEEKKRKKVTDFSSLLQAALNHPQRTHHNQIAESVKSYDETERSLRATWSSLRSAFQHTDLARNPCFACGDWPRGGF